MIFVMYSISSMEEICIANTLFNIIAEALLIEKN